MKALTLTDTSLLINLTNCNALDYILQLPNKSITIGDMVYLECKKIRSIIDIHISNGNIQIQNTNIITLKQFGEIKNKYNLGDGETECLCFGILIPSVDICTDDKKARDSIAKELKGNDRIVGSLSFLKECVSFKILECVKAYSCYLEMKEKGAFLPDIPKDFFCDIK